VGQVSPRATPGPAGRRTGAAGPRSAAAGSRPEATGPRCPRSLANELERTDGAQQLMTVEAGRLGTSIATVETWSFEAGCWRLSGGPWPSLIGDNGFSDHHREGDGTTPTGIYRFAATVFGDKPNPGYHGPYHLLTCGDWWDEDPTSAWYNSFQHVPCGEEPPFAADSEALWALGEYYPSLVVVEYNMHPAVPYAGSGIFVHADTGAPTLGCVSIPLADLDRFLRWLDPNDRPAIAMGPAGELPNF
jgi:L,D-peptidoglycan transpeptidase YkuD (ErfK/YbiS/YcfS/YnhG family)